VLSRSGGNKRSPKGSEEGVFGPYNLVLQITRQVKDEAKGARALVHLFVKSILRRNWEVDGHIDCGSQVGWETP
jgi:hypothetical protein